MKQLLMLGAVTLTLLLAGCAPSPASQTESQATAPPPSAAPPMPSSTLTTQAVPVVSPENLKFYTGEDDEFQTLVDIKKSAELTVEGVPNPPDMINIVIDRMEDVANYAPSEKTVRASLNKPAEQLTMEDFMAVYEEYFNAHTEVIFRPAGGDLYDTLKTICMQTAFSRLMSIYSGDKVPYAVTFTLHTNDTGLLIADNSIHNGVDDNALEYLGDYRLMSSGLYDVVNENGRRYLSGRMELIKKSSS